MALMRSPVGVVVVRTEVPIRRIPALVGNGWPAIVGFELMETWGRAGPGARPCADHARRAPDVGTRQLWTARRPARLRLLPAPLRPHSPTTEERLVGRLPGVRLQLPQPPRRAHHGHEKPVGQRRPG